MKITPLGWTAGQGWRTPLRNGPSRVDLVLYFAARELLEQADGPVRELISHFPNSVCAGCSTAGEILGATVSDDSLVALCITFNNTRVRGEVITVADASESSTAAATLAQRLAAPDLCHVLVLSDGLGVNGTLLTTGFRSSLPPGAAVTGGLAGDGSAFKTTLVGLGNEVGSKRVVAIGFYGSHLRAFHGSASGWEPFGPRRLVTRSVGNVLYALDDLPALPLYKRYLGERAAGLPSTGLLFPLQLLSDRDADQGLVRTILAVDEASESLTFAGDIPQGNYVRLMKASCDALVAGAEQSTAGLQVTADGAETFAILVSCVGRRLVMGQRTEEEIDAVLARLGKGVSTAGFYSYGEISPSGLVDSCDLHNQTMTLTVFSEEP